MKKVFLLSALLIFACSSDSDSDNRPTNGNSFNPPNWIQGVWMEQPANIFGYEFRADDICNILGNQASCLKSIIELYEDVPNVQTNVYEEISNTRYYLVFSYLTLEDTYEFEKISENEISNGQSIYTKQ
tara:strand:+ start:66 stop:452 length:387 start_codon:yes stop_codon:yes gene_type:complete